MVWYGMVNVDLYSAIITKVSNALDTLVSGEKHDNSSPLTPHIMLCYWAYPQNGDCVVAIDSVTSLRPVYTAANSIFGKVGRLASEEVTLQLIQEAQLSPRDRAMRRVN